MLNDKIVLKQNMCNIILDILIFDICKYLHLCFSYFLLHFPRSDHSESLGLILGMKITSSFSKLLLGSVAVLAKSPLYWIVPEWHQR